jgi:predicted ArsR family transcriptional regulator
MSELDLTDRSADVAMGARRSEVLALLRVADEPLTVAEVAERTGLHVNTARFHLDGLVTDRLVERSTEQRDAPGRPRVLYTARVDAARPRSFGLLAEMLTGLVASLESGGSAVVETGEAWGRHLVERPAPSQRVDAADATERLASVLAGIGFSPEVAARPDGADIRLHHCPFREVAERHTDVVCALHLGLMQGALDELRAPVRAESLEPFVTPRMCVGRLQWTKTAPASAGSRKGDRGR